MRVRNRQTDRSEKEIRQWENWNVFGISKANYAASSVGLSVGREIDSLSYSQVLLIVLPEKEI